MSVWEFPANTQSDLAGGNDRPRFCLPTRRAVEYPVQHPFGVNRESVRAYVTGIVINPDGTLGASLTSQGDLVVWNVTTGETMWSKQMTIFPISRLSLTTDGTVLIAWDAASDVGAWNLGSGEPVEEWKTKLGNGPIGVSRDGQTVASVDHGASKCGRRRKKNWWPLRQFEAFRKGCRGWQFRRTGGT